MADDADVALLAARVSGSARSPAGVHARGSLHALWRDAPVLVGAVSKYVVHQNDANALEIKHALQRIGATVLGGDKVDYIVGFQGKTYLLEIKTRRGK